MEVVEAWFPVFFLASIIMNGSLTGAFKVTKGVRQGDPLSPFIFKIAMEGINDTLKSAKEKGIFKGVNIPSCENSLSHMFYADDALFVGEWSKPNLKNLALAFFVVSTCHQD